MRCIIVRKSLQGTMIGCCETARSRIEKMIKIGKRSFKFDVDVDVDVPYTNSCRSYSMER